MISIDLSETTQKSALEIRDNVRDKIQSQTKSKTNFCLGLDFVSDYILQLYFGCNHLIIIICVGQGSGYLKESHLLLLFIVMNVNMNAKNQHKMSTAKFPCYVRD